MRKKRTIKQILACTLALTMSVPMTSMPAFSMSSQNGMGGGYKPIAL